MKRVAKDSVENRFTAKDLIGAAVYDPAGERIGDIADIDLRGAVPSSLSMAFSHDKADKSYAKPATGTGMASTGTPATSSGTGSMSDSSARPGASSATSATGSRTASDALGDSSRTYAGMDSPLQGATVFISVGGLWGIGDDLVSAPLSMLNYNTSEDRFELASTKAQVVSLAEGESEIAGYAGTSASSSTAAAKQAFGDEASRVRSALRADPQVAAFANSIQVTSKGDSLEISGTVSSEQQKQKVLDCARRATSMEIEDELDVK
jgi:osmotically-inducible protein OsmY